MYLFLKTAQAEWIEIALLNRQGEILKRKKIMASYQQSEKLLPAIARLLDGQLKKIKGVIAVKGPGSFSGLRVGLTAANVFGWALDVPVAGILAKGEETDELMRKGYNKIKKLKKFKPLMPVYGQEPKIGKAGGRG